MHPSAAGCSCRPTTNPSTPQDWERWILVVQAAIRRQTATADQHAAHPHGPHASRLVHTPCARMAARRTERPASKEQYDSRARLRHVTRPRNVIREVFTYHPGGRNTHVRSSTKPLDPRDIPVVILCGGMGTRLREASEKLPKPLVDIGGKPILWHIMKTYAHHGFRRFVLCLGYKSELIRRYFLDYREKSATSPSSSAPPRSRPSATARRQEDWEITFVDTGLLTGTGARIRRVAEYLDADTFMLTYGDGIGDVDIDAVLASHQAGGRLATVTGVHPASRYGEMHVDGDRVTEFNEKPTLADGWVSGGFFAFDRLVHRQVPRRRPVD